MTLEKLSSKFTMKVDYCLILAAGFGTRMGPIGKKIPKLLWPLFNKVLLEYQIQYAKEYFGVQKIFCNTHYLAEEFKAYSHLDLEFLHEPEILDVGGGIHNLATQVGYKGSLLVISGDQFYFGDSDSLEKSLEIFQNNGNLLYGIEIAPNSAYNRLQLDSQNGLSGIVPPSSDAPSLTYSGVSLFNLAQLERSKGASKFFDTVAPFKQRRISVFNQFQRTEYFDFGTLERYLESAWELYSIIEDSKPCMAYDFFNKTLDHQSLSEIVENVRKDQRLEFGDLLISSDRVELNRPDQSHKL